MALYGDLSTMSLPDLLRWASADKKTGVLELERNKIRRCIEFRKGWISSCGSDDPSALLGQFLLSRGRISADDLRDALARQQQERKNLGSILVDMGRMTQKDLSRQINAKAEEIVYGLFDWDEAIFRFHDGATVDPNHIEVSSSVDQILERGLHRSRELAKIRHAFPSSGMVLARSCRPVPEELLEKPVARRILDLVDGDRTLAEMLVRGSASEFLVLRFLHKLLADGFVEVVEERPRPAGAPTLLDQRSDRRITLDLDDLADLGDESLPQARPVAPEPQSGPAAGAKLDVEVEVATRLLSCGDSEAALGLLNAMYEAHPEETFLRRLVGRAEEAFVGSARRKGLGPEAVPTPLADADLAIVDELGSLEAFVLTMVDGRQSIETLGWLSPLRPVDLLLCLRKLERAGAIRIVQPAGAPA